MIKKLVLAAVGIIVAFIAVMSFAPKIGNALQLYNSQYNYSYFNNNTNTSTACVVLYGSAGTLHALAVGTPGVSGVVTLYDTNKGTVTAMTNATASIAILGIDGISTSTATSTATGTLAIVLNGQTVTSASVANGSTSVQAATAITTAITASSTVLGVTATSSSNIVTITASEIGAIGNINLPNIAGQNGFLFYNTFTNSAGTQVISQTTFAATTTNTSYPQIALYDSVFKNGLCIQETTATSAVTVSWQQQ